MFKLPPVEKIIHLNHLGRKNNNINPHEYKNENNNKNPPNKPNVHYYNKISFYFVDIDFSNKAITYGLFGGSNRELLPPSLPSEV